jgi:thiosulfate/3-mercaptopyruvate sulfurtransferase
MFCDGREAWNHSRCDGGSDNFVSIIMTFTTLIDAETLAAHCTDNAFVIVDCRYNLDDEEWGKHEYVVQHVPGAVYVHLSHDLAGKKTDRNGRHPLPDPSVFAQTVGRLGVTTGMQVVVYDQDTGIYASRLWWLLRWLGHDAVAVLDGGFSKWLAEGRMTTSGEEVREERQFIGAPQREFTVDIEHITKHLGDRNWCLVDARAPERYSGTIEPIDRIAGHIPGAVNHFFKQNLNECGTFRSTDELRQRLRDVLDGASPEHVVCYCGSGVTACHNLLALEHAGLSGAKLYVGSWSEWSSDPSRPIERSPQG